MTLFKPKDGRLSGQTPREMNHFDPKNGPRPAYLPFLGPRKSKICKTFLPASQAPGRRRRPLRRCERRRQKSLANFRLFLGLKMAGRLVWGHFWGQNGSFLWRSGQIACHLLA